MKYKLYLPAFFWALAALILAGWCFFSWVAFNSARTTSPTGISQAIFAITGAIAIGLVWKALTWPCVAIEIRDRRMFLSLIYPYGLYRYQFGSADVRSLDVESEFDSDGERSYVAFLEVGALSRLQIERSPDRDDAERVVVEIRDAMGLPPARG
ncbi:MAG: hypothetical protein JNM13_17405 [Hyphomicrobiaceae bacterium]|nr:hypothetical protein [Hyphomicrobiaceae bacterium]